VLNILSPFNQFTWNKQLLLFGWFDFEELTGGARKMTTSSMKNGVKNSYAEDYQRKIKEEIPLAIQAHIAIVAIYMSLLLIQGVFEAIAPAPYANPGGLIASTILALILLGLYLQLVKRRKNWARLVLGILTIPIGLILLLSKEAKSYCIQKERGD
jgi:hypothetical protein